MASDFKDLFGEDWKPKEFRGENYQPVEGSNDSSSQFPVSENPSREFSGELENRSPRSLHEKEVRVIGVFVEQAENVAPQHFVLFRDNHGRLVRIFIGQWEALMISNAVENEVTDRPLTHDMIKIIIERLNAKVERIIIDDLWNETFYAKVTLVRASGENIDIDARPSDAVALALRFKAPIYMAESVLEMSIPQE